MKVTIVSVSWVLFCWTACRPMAAQTLINFEDLSVGTLVTTQYAAKGVVFSSGAYLFEDSHAHSGTHVLRVDSPATEFPSGPLTMEFTAGQRNVKFFASVTGVTTPYEGTAQAFDSSGAVIATDGPKAVQPNSYTTSFVLTSARSAIIKVQLEMAKVVFEAIDDLSFVGPTGTLPKTAPVVKITSPASGEELTSQNALLTGTITGEALLPNPWVVMDSPRPPGSTAPPFTFTVPLTGTGSTHSFSWSGGVGIGPQTLTVTATNIAGMTGTASVDYTYLPVPIQNRFSQAGGAGQFGQFSFGLGGGSGCTVAVYQQGAIFYLNNMTYVALGAMFSRWLQTEGQPRGDLLCATSEETSVAGYPGTTRQDFQQGRLYSSGGRALYVPPVFANAVDKLGAEVATGVPVSEPANLPPVPVWNFQRFQRADNVSLPSTLEVSGSPAVLYVQRQGGDLSDLHSAGVPLTQATATIEWQFQCSGPDGPCNVVPPVSAPPFQDPGDLICDNTTYPRIREWEPIINDQLLTDGGGYVKSSTPSNLDNPFSHEYHGGPPTFPSDWRIHLWPIVPYGNLLAAGKTDMEVEYEDYYAHAMEAGWGWPVEGDLLFVAGRWVVDCGHSDYHTEIHPPSVVIFARTIEHGGRPATVAFIWANGFYSGAPVDFVIEAPPRTAPDANLVLEKPTDDTAALGLSVQFSWNAHAISGHFSAPLRQMSIDSGNGEMFWQYLRGYEGEWILYWDK